MRTILALIIGTVLIAGFGLSAAEKERSGKLYHVVSFKFKDSASKDQIKQVEDAFRDLKKKINEIQAYEWGTNVSPEKHDKGFTHGFIMTFDTAANRDAYLPHPEHERVRDIVVPCLERVVVFDFEV